MEELQTFEYTPDRQPDEAAPITVTLEPLDADGKWNMEGSMGRNEGVASMKVITKIAKKYIVGMSGGGFGNLSGDALDRKLREVLDDPPLKWRMFFAQVASHSWAQALLKEDLAKKS
jgi:hypothetical protein